MCWTYWLGIAIVILTHLSMIMKGYSQHAALNLGAAALILYGCRKYLF